MAYRLKTRAAGSTTMIFVTDAQSSLSYVGLDWTALTGQPLIEALGTHQRLPNRSVPV